MLRLDSLKLAVRLSLGFGIVLALLVAIAAVAVVSLHHGQARSYSVAESLRRAGVAEQWRGLTMINVSRTLAIAKSGNNAALKAYFEPRIKQTSGEISILQKQLEAEASADGTSSRFESVAAKRQRYVATRDAAFKLLDAGDSSVAGLVENQLLPSSEAYIAAVTDFGRYERQRAEDMVAEGDAQAAAARGVAISMAAASILTGMFTAWLLTRSITGPLRQAVNAVETIASGDLSQTIEVQGRDELAQLLAGIGSMQGALRRLVGQVRSASESIQVASSEVALGSQDLSARTEQSAASLQETASSVEEISGTIRHTAESARMADQLATSAADAAVDGAAAAGRMKLTMDRITQHAEKVRDIVSVINGIAFQTNILALNAAVEAARAGQQGVGFAVVAGEVRTLAQRCASAADEIRAVIGESSMAVADGAGLAIAVDSSMVSITESIRRVTAVLGEIRMASSEQSEGIGQVDIAVAQLDQSTQQNAALVEETAAAAESLRQQAGVLVAAVSVFRL